MTNVTVRPTVSSNTLVLNEASHIDHLISNLLDSAVDEIVIVDGGSRDGTWEKVLEWSKRTGKVVAIQWPQRAGSEYKLGFNEVARRNLMIEASSSDYILYIDADERIGPSFMESLDPSCDCIVTELMHFWNGRVRVSSETDRVWSPERQIRVFRRVPGFSFKSADKNKLHNSLTWRGIKVPLGYSRGRLWTNVGRVIRAALRLKTGGLERPPRLFHYHYYDLTRRKANDLRAAEFAWPMEEVSEHGRRDKHGVVYVTSPTHDPEAELVTARYYGPTAPRVLER